MSETIEHRPRKLGGRISLTAWKLRQDRLAKIEGPTVSSGTQRQLIPPPEVGRRFDPWLRMGGERAGKPWPIRQLAAFVLDPLGYERMMRAYEEANNPRQRAMAERDKRRLVDTIEIILTNLVLSVLEDDKAPGVKVSLRSAKQGMTRYDRPGLSNLPRVLETFSSHDNVEGPWRLYKSRQRGVPSVVAAEQFVRGFAKYDVGFYELSIANFYREPGFETIILARTTRDYIEDTRSREWIDYKDTPQSIHFREELAAINAHLRSADIGFEPDGGEPVPLLRKELRRYFSLLEGDPDDEPRFDQGGRLFDGWWLNLEKERRGSIRIEGEPIADLDFANMFLRLAYLDAGHEPPPGDLYGSIPGLSEPYWRDGVKVLVNAMLFRTTPMLRLPRDPGLRKNLPPGAKGSVMREAILAGHPLLSGTFETGAGYRLMFMESQILVAALLKMIDAGITALPIHDGAMVPRSKHAAAAECMAAASEEITGHRLPIVLKSLFN